MEFSIESIFQYKHIESKSVQITRNELHSSVSQNEKTYSCAGL